MIHNRRLKAFAFFGLSFMILIGFSSCPSPMKTIDTICMGSEGEGCIGLKVNTDNELIIVKITTDDGSDITVEGCKKTAIKSGVQTNLHSTDEDKIILRGNIIDSSINGSITAAAIGGGTPQTVSLKNCNSVWRFTCYTRTLASINVENCSNLESVDCSRNKITELNLKGCRSLEELNCAYNLLEALHIQDCSALKKLKCQGNQLNGTAFINILNNLPKHTQTTTAFCILYTEEIGITEGNVSDFLRPPALKKAFETAKQKGWIMKKQTETGKTEL